MTVIRPMLAATYGVDKKHVNVLPLPMLASPKIDGIRALVVDGKVQSRSGKLIPNPTVQERFGRPAFEGFDVELAVGPVTAKDLMQRTMAVMSSSPPSVEDSAALTFNVFDKWDSPNPYWSRLDELIDLEAKSGMWPWVGVSLVPHELLHTLDEVLEYEARMLAAGFEGIMLNSPSALYKHGRAGKKAELVKVKRFVDDEAVIVGCEEMMHNDNTAFESELGRTKRATLQENLRPAGVLGSFLLRAVTGTFAGKLFYCSGFTAAQREEYWRDRGGMSGRLVTFKHFEQVGVVDAPRQPVFKGFRSALDTSGEQ